MTVSLRILEQRIIIERKLLEHDAIVFSQAAARARLVHVQTSNLRVQVKLTTMICPSALPTCRIENSRWHRRMSLSLSRSRH